MLKSTVLLGILFAVPLLAQTRESIDVQIMELEVSVLDRSGKPVEGLKPEDFDVRIGRRAAPIKNFFAVRQGRVVDESRGTAAAAEISPETSIPTTLVIFIDETNLRLGSRRRALDALERYVRANVGPLTTAMLIRYNKHLDVRTRPTEKPGYILAELEKLKGETFAGHELDREREVMISEIDDILFGGGITTTGNTAGESPDTIFYRLEKYAENRTAEVDRTLAALESAIELASGFSGRRVLLYVSEGLPQQPAADLFDYWTTALRKSVEAGFWRMEGARTDNARAMRFDRTAQFERVAKTAQRARVAIYSFDAVGLRGVEGRGPETSSRQGEINATLMAANLRGGLQLVAEKTGGRYIANENNVDRVLSVMSEQFSYYYSIGVQPRGGDIVVTVKNRPDARVFSSRRRPPRTREEDVEQSIRARLYTRATDNPLNAKLDVAPPARVNDQCMVQLKLDVPPPAQFTPEVMDVHFVMLNERNDESEVRHVVVPLASGRVAHSMTLRVQPQQHVLSLAVANPASGEASYLQSVVDGTVCR